MGFTRTDYQRQNESLLILKLYRPVEDGETMETSIEGFNLILAFSPVADILLCIGIICALGLFLWNKGRFSITSKR